MYLDPALPEAVKAQISQLHKPRTILFFGLFCLNWYRLDFLEFALKRVLNTWRRIQK